MNRKRIIWGLICICLVLAGVFYFRSANVSVEKEESRKIIAETPPRAQPPAPEPAPAPPAPKTETAPESEPVAAEAPAPPPPPSEVGPELQALQERLLEEKAMKKSMQMERMESAMKSRESVGERAMEILEPKETTIAVTPETAAPEVAPAESSTPQPASTTVERYPTMECPDQVKVDQEFALMVSLTEDQITPEVKIKSGQATPDGALSMQLPESTEGWQIDVVLSAPGFSFVKGSNNASIQLPPAGDSTPALFQLKAKQPRKPGKSETIYATFWRDGTFLAKVAKDITVTDPSAPKEVTTRSAKAEAPAASSAESDTAPAPSVPAIGAKPVVHATQSPRPAPIGTESEPVDLTIYVLENLDPDKPYQSEIIIASPWLQPSLQKYETPSQADKWLQFHYDKFVKSLGKLVQSQGPNVSPDAAKTARAQVQALMNGFGDELYQKFAPEPFKTAFWHLVDRLGPEFDTIQIFSNNPVIPWELMRPSRPDGSEQRNFLGIEFNIGRWHVSNRSRQLDRPPQSLEIKELDVVAPGYKPDEKLPGQTDEIKMLSGFNGFRTTPGRLENVERLLESSPSGIIHFAGHGSAKPTADGVYEYFISLEDTALDLTTFRGLTGSGAFLNHPFFFFNACEMGRSSKVADFVSGWAPAVLESGASGFIGALWPVDDQGAAKFAARFYQELDRGLAKGPVRVDKVLRDARRLYLEEGNPTYLAFIYYGDPNLEFSRSTLKGKE